MLMRDAQNIVSLVEEYQEVAHTAVNTIYSICNYSLRLTIFIQFKLFTHNSKS